MAEEKIRFAMVNQNGWTENIDSDDYFGILSCVGRDTHNRWTLLLRNGVVVETELSHKAWEYTTAMDDAYREASERVRSERTPEWLRKLEAK